MIGRTLFAEHGSNRTEQDRLDALGWLLALLIGLTAARWARAMPRR